MFTVCPPEKNKRGYEKISKFISSTYLTKHNASHMQFESLKKLINRAFFIRNMADRINPGFVERNTSVINLTKNDESSLIQTIELTHCTYLAKP